MEDIRNMSSGKMFVAQCRATADEISMPSSKRSRKLPTPTYMCLNLRAKERPTDLLGDMLEASWLMDTAYAGALWMPSTGECHKGAEEYTWSLHTAEYPVKIVESTLSQILQLDAPEKYYLSAKACQGILNRAERRGKVLPKMLEEALKEVVMLCASKNEPVSPGGGKGILIDDAQKSFTLSTLLDQSLCLIARCERSVEGSNNDVTGLDCYNQTTTGCVSKAITSAATDSDHVPCVVYESHPMDSRIKELGDVSPTVSCKRHKGAADTPLRVFDITGTNSNSMKSPTPDSCFRERDVARTLDSFVASPECNQGRNVVVETVGALCARDYKGVGSQYVSEGKCVVQETVCIGNGQLNILTNGKPPRKYIVRRLSPLECCRLQGFPDWWEDGVEGSDSARYKMWGNGMALPNMLHVMRGIARVEGE